MRMKTHPQYFLSKPRRSSKAGMTIGIDLGDIWSHYCTLNEDGEVVDRGRFRTNPSGVDKRFRDIGPARVVWARGLGFARNGHAQQAEKESETLRQLEDRLRASGDGYWATEVDIMRREVMAWTVQAANQPEEAGAILRSVADDEDGIEKLPVTPGPIIPAREQLGELLLVQDDPASASKAFQTALANAPGRRGTLQGAAQAAQLSLSQ